MSVPPSQRGSAPPGTDLPEGDEMDAHMVGVPRNITERQRAEDALHEREVWLAGQRGALEAALNSAPLATSLGMLVHTATDQLGEGVRAAFYLANPAGAALHHVVGMPTASA